MMTRLAEVWDWFCRMTYLIGWLTVLTLFLRVGFVICGF